MFFAMYLRLLATIVRSACHQVPRPPLCAVPALKRMALEAPRHPEGAVVRRLALVGHGQRRRQSAKEQMSSGRGTIERRTDLCPSILAAIATCAARVPLLTGDADVAVDGRKKGLLVRERRHGVRQIFGHRADAPLYLPRQLSTAVGTMREEGTDDEWPASGDDSLVDLAAPGLRPEETPVALVISLWKPALWVHRFTSTMHVDLQDWTGSDG